MPHILTTTHRIQIAIGTILSTSGREVEDNDVGLLLTGYVNAVLVRCLDEQVVTIYKLQILTSCHLDACIASFAETHVLLTDIDDVIAILLQVVHRTLFRAVINDNDLALTTVEREGEDAVDTFAEHLHRQVKIGQNKTDQRFLHILWASLKIVHNFFIPRLFNNNALIFNAPLNRLGSTLIRGKMGASPVRSQTSI